MNQVRLSKRHCLGQETGLDRRCADHRSMPMDLDHSFLLFAGRPGIFPLQRLRDGGCGAGFI